MEKDHLRPEVWTWWSHTCVEPAQSLEKPASVWTLRQAIPFRASHERRPPPSYKASWSCSMYFLNCELSLDLCIHEDSLLHAAFTSLRGWMLSTEQFISWTFFINQGFSICHEGTLENIHTMRVYLIKNQPYKYSIFQSQNSGTQAV